MNALISGGGLPSKARGRTHTKYMHIADVYATLCGIADASDLVNPNSRSLPLDIAATRAKLPGIDSIDMWPTLMDMEMDDETQFGPRMTVHLSEQALIRGEFKLIVGVQPFNMWQGQVYPNATGPQPLFPAIDLLHKYNHDCGKFKVDISPFFPSLRPRVLVQHPRGPQRARMLGQPLPCH